MRGRGLWPVARIWIMVMTLMAGHGSRVTGQPESSLAQQAEEAWQRRAEPGQTERAISLWMQHRNRPEVSYGGGYSPDRDEYLIKLTKACGRAVRHAVTKEDRKHWADLAREFGAQAIQKNPANAEAYAVYGEALGQWSNVHKGMGSLSVVEKAVETLQKAIVINPKLAYAHMLLAEFYRQSPRLFSVGSKKKALAEARLAVEYGPGYAINHLVLARVLLDLGKKEEAISELKKIGTLSPPADAVPETRADQETALTMLESLGLKPAETKSPTNAQQPPQCGEAGGICAELP